MTARTLPERLPARPRDYPSLVVACALAASLAGCSTLGGRHKEDQIPQYGIIDPRLPKELDMVSLPPHVLEPPDEIEVTVHPTLPDMAAATSLIVRSDGNVDLGLYGDVYVSGLNLEQTEHKIARHLAIVLTNKNIPAREPLNVSVRLVNGRDSKRYYVLGTVATQNSFPITGNETVVDAILQAGLRSNSLPEKAYLIRPHAHGGADQIFRIDWFGITQRGDNLTNYQIFPGDRIYVPGGRSPSLLKSLAGGG